MRQFSNVKREPVGWILAAGLATLPTPAVMAQDEPGPPESNWWEMPPQDAIENAGSFVAPKLEEQAKKLARQPNFTGMWGFVQPEGACGGPLFDPPNSICPPPLPRGEAGFGPLPGTKLTGIPYNEKYQKMYDQHVADALEGKARDTFAACVPYGVPRAVGEAPSTFDIVQAPDIMWWYFDYPRTERRIFLYDQPEPLEENAMYYSEPTYSGRSIGYWEGDTLVVHTTNMINAFLDETAAPHSDKLEMTERIRLIMDDVIENEMTLVDTEAFTEPWVVKRYYRRVPRDFEPRPFLDLNDRPCVPNVKMDDDGFQVMLLPQEIEAEEARAKGRPQPTQ